jgi:hypothetical protein
MTTDNFCFYLQNILIQTGGQWYSDTSPFSIPWYIAQIKMTAADFSKLERQLSFHFTKMPNTKCLIFVDIIAIVLLAVITKPLTIILGLF